MAKKILSFCMAFVMMAVCAPLTSCDKEEVIEVTAAYFTRNADGIYVEDSTLDLLNAAFQKALKDVNGTEAHLMADALKSNFKANVIATVPDSEIEKFRSSDDMYFLFVVMKRSDPTVVYSRARLYGSEF